MKIIMEGLTLIDVTVEEAIRIIDKFKKPETEDEIIATLSRAGKRGLRVDEVGGIMGTRGKGTHAALRRLLEPRNLSCEIVRHGYKRAIRLVAAEPEIQEKPCESLTYASPLQTGS